MRQSCLAILIVSVLAGCGYKGPLYLPKEETPPAMITPAAAPVDQQQDNKQ